MRGAAAGQGAAAHRGGLRAREPGKVLEKGEEMIKIENTEVFGWEAAIRGMRNPMNSWDKSDSGTCSKFHCDLFVIGSNDFDLMMKLACAGPVHAKYRRMINVTCDITAPLYWWKEFDTYKVGTVANSCSTMHRIHEKEFMPDDFSREHVGDVPNCDPVYDAAMDYVIYALNEARRCYIDTKDKKYWCQMIQLLPSSYNQKRTIQMNYEVLVGMYRGRKNHKLDEWHTLCDWIKELPYSEIITLEDAVAERSGE